MTRIREEEEVQPQRNNDRGETSESAGQNKSQHRTIGVDGARYRLAADSNPRDTAATEMCIITTILFCHNNNHFMALFSGHPGRVRTRKTPVV